jgi:hypothetical protein
MERLGGKRRNPSPSALLRRCGRSEAIRELRMRLWIASARSLAMTMTAAKPEVLT